MLVWLLCPKKRYTPYISTLNANYIFYMVFYIDIFTTFPQLIIFNILNKLLLFFTTNVREKIEFASINKIKTLIKTKVKWQN